MAAVGVVAFTAAGVAFTVGAAAVSMVGAFPMVVAGFIAVAEDIVEAAPTGVCDRSVAARGLLAEEVTTEVEVFLVDQRRVITERAVVRTAGSVRRAA
jgi:hypothetical protein